MGSAACGRSRNLCSGSREVRSRLFEHFGILLRRKFIDLSLHEIANLLVRRPESLTDTDRIVNNLSHHRIPISALTVVENGIATHSEIVYVAVGHHCNNGHLGSGALASAVAVEKEHSACSRHSSLLAHIRDFDTEVAAALVDIETTGLKN